MGRPWLDRLWARIADKGHAFARVPDEPGPRAQALCTALLSEAGEVSGAAIARELVRAVRQLDADGRLEFLRFVSAGFGPDPVALRRAAEQYLQDPTAHAEHALAQAAEPPRRELLLRMNMADGATGLLIELRALALKHLKADPSLKLAAADLEHLLTAWFNRGFLELRSIDWKTPASLLEKLMKYEAVHAIHGWDDLRRRLAPDRRCFAFFHPALRDEPLIFVEVALCKGIASGIAPILAPASVYPPPESFDTAIFYSISNCQEGLRGISFGNLLIKQVVEELSAELPGLRTFATLSPVPTLRKALPEGGDEQTLLRACARYLTDANDGRGPRDPVARFHLGNGARLERINWAANPSQRGQDESYGIMVNYLYDAATIEANHEVFARTGLVARGEQVADLLSESEPAADAVRSAS